MSFGISNQLNKWRIMFKESKKNTQEPDFWDRLSEISDRDIPYHLSDHGIYECENPWPEATSSHKGERDS